MNRIQFISNFNIKMCAVIILGEITFDTIQNMHYIIIKFKFAFRTFKFAFRTSVIVQLPAMPETSAYRQLNHDQWKTSAPPCISPRTYDC